MSNLSHTMQRSSNVTKGHGYKTDKERREKKAAKRQKKKDKIFHSAEMPDEEMIKRNERRKAASRQGSRTSTVLTNQDQLG